MKQNVVGKTVLVTGGLGHVGSRLIRELPAEVGKVIIVDNLATQRYASLFDLPKTARYHFIEEDVREANFDRLLANVDVVIHLAALTNAEASVNVADEVMSVNVEGLRRVAEACQRHNVSLLFPSTTSVQAGLNPYAESKRIAEKILAEMGQAGLAYVVLRWGTIFGFSPGMRFHTAVNKFLWQAMTDQPLTVWRTAWQQQRPYLDLQDCISSISLVLNQNLFAGKTFNVMTGQYTVEEVVTEIRRWRPEVEVSLVDSAVMSEASFTVDDEPFRASGFMPTGSLRRGIGEVVEHLAGVSAKEYASLE